MIKDGKPAGSFANNILYIFYLFLNFTISIYISKSTNFPITIYNAIERNAFRCSVHNVLTISLQK